MTEDLAINLLAAVIAFVAGWTLRALYKYVRDIRPAVRMWRAAAGSDFSIVVADGPLSEKNRPTIHPAEFAAATELSGYLAHSLRINVTRVRASINFPLDEALEGNLILIGGPIHNQVHRLMLERLELPYEFQDRDLVRVKDGKVFAPVSSADGVAKIDYGLIVITANPYNPDARLVLLAGCRTFGCLGATRAIIGPTITQFTSRAQAGRSYCLVVQMDVVDNYVGRVQVVDHAYFTATDRVG
ncbi:hypothetical protein [Kribbella sp. CA-294648]|uniref:hypothetical protein n=1 Tax=Kribbella sp. CA-294648 TaxID=3239948 RepID=UPI003D9220F3